MNIKLDCEVIQDMLPLYEDDCCSDKTKVLVEDHLKDCETCRKTSKLFQTELPTDTAPPGDPDADKIKDGIRRIKRKHIALGITLIAIFFFLVFLYHALTPFQVSIPSENCNIVVSEISEPEPSGQHGGMWEQSILIDVEYSAKINKFDSLAPGISVLWREHAQIQMNGETLDVLLIDVYSYGLQNIWKATHADLSGGTRTYTCEMHSLTPDENARLDAIYHVEGLNKELAEINAGGIGYCTELVAEKGHLVWSAEE